MTQVLVIPAAQNPLKQSGLLLPDEVRLSMARLALAHVPKVAVLDLELYREPPSFSAETLRTLMSIYPRGTFEVALGWDAYCDLPRWHAIDRILTLAGLLVAPRAGLSSPPKPPEGILGYLPEMWARRLRPEREGVWVEESGRTVLRYVPLNLPDMSASGTLAQHTWNNVPQIARPVLFDYLKKAGIVP